MRRGRSGGFTLIELMIVLVIAAIIATFAIPSYNNVVRKTHRKDAMAALQGLAQAMERYYAQNNTYRGTAVGGTDEGAPRIFPAKSPTDGQARYNLTLKATATTYTLKATPIAGSGQDGDGFIELDSTGKRGWDRDNSGGIGAGENTWDEH